MKCSRVIELLSPYMDDHLAVVPRNRVAAHLAECSECSKVHGIYHKLSTCARALPDPTVPPGLWSRVEAQLQRVETKSRLARVPAQLRRWSLITLLAAAATVLIAGGVFVKPHLPPFRAHDPLAQDVREFLDTFPRDPAAAQKLLLARYGGRLLTPAALAQTMPFAPVALRQPPPGYVRHGSYLLKMPCCRCSQTVYQRDGGGWVAVFEHDTCEKPNWLAGSHCVQAQFSGHACTLTQTGTQLAAHCQVRNRQFTIVGARDLDELKTFIAWLGTTGDERESVRS